MYRFGHAFSFGQRRQTQIGETAMAVLDVNSQGEAYRVGAALKLGKAQGFLTDANVTAADTVAGLRTAVTNAVPKQGASEVNRSQLQKAINIGASLGFLTDAA